MTAGPDPYDASPEPRPRRRARWVAAGIVVVIAVVAVVAWSVWLPGWRPALERGERYGIDVSNHQGPIDWRRVADDDIDFAYIKATEGRDFTDRKFEVNWGSADAAGLERGAYHYFTLCSSGADQAAHFLDVAPPDPTALAPAVDLEALTGHCNPTVEGVNRELDVFVDQVERAWGEKVLLYIGDGFEDRFRVRDRLARPLWHPRFRFRPDVDGWVIWQANPRARVDGITGIVDLDVQRPQ